MLSEMMGEVCCGALSVGELDVVLQEGLEFTPESARSILNELPISNFNVYPYFSSLNG